MWAEWGLFFCSNQFSLNCEFTFFCCQLCRRIIYNMNNSCRLYDLYIIFLNYLQFFWKMFEKFLFFGKNLNLRGNVWLEYQKTSIHEIMQIIIAMRLLSEILFKLDFKMTVSVLFLCISIFICTVLLLFTTSQYIISIPLDIIALPYLC